MSSREFLASAFMCSHKPPRVTQTKCVFLISAAVEPGNFVLIKTSQWFRDGGAHTRTGSAGGWRFLGTVSAPLLTWPALAARNQGLVCDCKSCCFAERTRLYHNLIGSGNTQMEKHSLGTSRNVSTTISMKWGDRFLWRPVFKRATAISLMFGTVTFRCVRKNLRAGGQRFGFRLQKEAIIKKPNSFQILSSSLSIEYSFSYYCHDGLISPTNCPWDVCSWELSSEQPQYKIIYYFCINSCTF